MTDEPTAEEIIKAVEKQLAGLFAKGTGFTIITHDEAAEYFQKADACGDRTLADGYRRLARKLRKKSKRRNTKK